MAPKKDQASSKKVIKKAKAGEGMGGGQLAKMLGLLKYQAQHGKVQVKKKKASIFHLHTTTMYYLPAAYYHDRVAFCFLLSSMST